MDNFTQLEQQYGLNTHRPLTPDEVSFMTLPLTTFSLTNSLAALRPILLTYTFILAVILVYQTSFPYTSPRVNLYVSTPWMQMVVHSLLWTLGATIAFFTGRYAMSRFKAPPA